MADFTPDIASEILAACQSGGADAAGAFGRALDGEFALVPGDPSTVSSDAIPDTWNGPGLIVSFQVGDSGALLLLAESSELLPDWYTQPDDTGRSKLATLAQELGYTLLPESFTPDKTSAARVRDLAGAFGRAEPAFSCGLFAFKVFVNLEEVLNFSEVVGRHLRQLFNVVPQGIGNRNAQYLLVVTFVVGHAE